MRSKRGDPSLDEFDQVLIDIIGNEHPETLKQVIEPARLRLSNREDAIMERVLHLESQGKISFEKPTATLPASFAGYFFSSWAS